MPELRLPKGFFVEYARSNLRSFPWRHHGISSFELLVAELLLIQTKAEDVAKIWPELMKRYPSPARVAAARMQSLRALLRPLGLQNQRACALRAVSRTIMAEFGGRVPKELSELLSLPYVGLYVACAVTSFGHGRRVPIVDANILRVFSRVTGSDFGRDLRRSHQVWVAAWSILPARNHARHNYGVLDFAAQVCTARAPLCASCGLRAGCAYARDRAQNGNVDRKRPACNT